MTLDDFWALIHRSSTATTSQRERTGWLTGRLARLPAPAIIEFELHLTAQRKRVDTRLMWGAAWNILQGWCSGDSFFYITTEQAALKCLYLALMSLDPTGKGRKRRSNRWKGALNAFDITFDGRLAAGRS